MDLVKIWPGDEILNLLNWSLENVIFLNRKYLREYLTFVYLLTYLFL